MSMRTLDPKAVAPAPSEIIVVRTHRLWCDGGDGALGHPRVYLEMGESQFVECSYCDRRFVLQGHSIPEDEQSDPADYEGAGGH
jgi:uncharacterized Zn-finger protein